MQFIVPLADWEGHSAINVGLPANKCALQVISALIVGGGIELQFVLYLAQDILYPILRHVMF